MEPVCTGSVALPASRSATARMQRHKPITPVRAHHRPAEATYEDVAFILLDIGLKATAGAIDVHKVVPPSHLSREPEQPRRSSVQPSCRLAKSSRHTLIYGRRARSTAVPPSSLPPSTTHMYGPPLVVVVLARASLRVPPTPTTQPPLNVIG